MLGRHLVLALFADGPEQLSTSQPAMQQHRFVVGGQLTHHAAVLWAQRSSIRKPHN
jgi:hypothetical protein